MGTGLTYLISIKDFRFLPCIATGKCCFFRKDIFGRACRQTIRFLDQGTFQKSEYNVGFHEEEKDRNMGSSAAFVLGVSMIACQTTINTKCVIVYIYNEY